MSGRAFSLSPTCKNLLNYKNGSLTCPNISSLLLKLCLQTPQPELSDPLLILYFLVTLNKNLSIFTYKE